MPRFTLSQFLMAVALVAIAIAYMQSEGCGHRITMIESLSFSPDGSHILAVRLDARDARTPMKGYKANLSRTVGWLDATTGAGHRVIHNDYYPANAGPAFRFLRIGRTSVLGNPSNDRIAILPFGGGNIIQAVGSSKPIVTKRGMTLFTLLVHNLAIGWALAATMTLRLSTGEAAML